MLDEPLRKMKDSALAPVADAVGQHIRPTTITVIACAVGVGAGLAAWAGWYAVGLALWLVNRGLDGLDGAVARRHGKKSDIGGYLDTLLDHVVYATIPIMLALGVGGTDVLIAAVWLMGTFYVNGASWMMLSAILERRTHDTHRLTTVNMAGGLIEGTETIAFYIAFFLFPSALVPLFALMGALVVVTMIGRLRWAMRVL